MNINITRNKSTGTKLLLLQRTVPMVWSVKSVTDRCDGGAPVFVCLVCTYLFLKLGFNKKDLLDLVVSTMYVNLLVLVQ